jgi:hypothetical protein
LLSDADNPEVIMNSLIASNLGLKTNNYGYILENNRMQN